VPNTGFHLTAAPVALWVAEGSLAHIRADHNKPDQIVHCTANVSRRKGLESVQNEQSHLTQTISAELGSLSQDISDDIAQRSKARRVVTDLFKALEENNADTAARILQNRTQQGIKLKATVSKRTPRTEVYPLGRLYVRITEEQ
jgi:hypothetical protein